MTWIFLRDIAVSLIAYGLVFCSHVGLGWGAARVLRLQLRSRDAPFAHFWLGWAATLLILQALHLFVPLSGLVVAPLLGLGLVLLLRYAKEAGPAFIPRPTVLYAIGLGAIAILVAVRAMLAPQVGDSGLYHFNSIRWLNQSPLVLGLGNLHGRLAYNQSLFVYVAQLNLFPFFRHGHNVGISILLLTALAESLRHAAPALRSWRGSGQVRLDSAAALLAFPFLIYVATAGSISSPSPDYASYVLQVILLVYFVRRLMDTWSKPEGEGFTGYLYILLATAVTLKLSNAAYALAMMIILAFWELAARGAQRRQRRSRFASHVGASALILTLWALRGLAASGCAAYPSSLGCVDVAWAVPNISVGHEAAWIYSWARDPGKRPDEVLHSWAWFKPWIERVLAQRVTVVQPMTLGLLSLLAAGPIAYLCRATWRVPRAAWLLPIPPAAGILVWFWLAPDPRFALGLIWALQMAGVLALLAAFEPSAKAGRAAAMISFALLSASVLSSMAAHPLDLADVFQSGYQPIPQVQLVRETSLHGLDVLIPKKGDQCWDSELPCTPYFNGRLQLRQTGIWPEFLVTDVAQASKDPDHP